MICHMDGEFIPQWRPEPEPSNALERLLQKAEDPAVHGRMMRALWATELHTLIAYHPEMVGEMELQNGSPMPQFIQIHDATGVFIPVFSSEAVAEYSLAKNGGKMGPQALASMAGEGFFRIIQQLGCNVVLNPGMTHRLLLEPEAIAALIDGEFRHTRPAHDSPEMTTLHGVEPDSLPGVLRDGIRRFCDRGRVAIAVYPLVACDPETGKPNLKDLRLILRLRSEDNDFYNDFRLLVAKLSPPNFPILTGVMFDSDEQGLAWLNQQKPLWPVLDL
jgi:hypothetical protein